MEIPIRRIKEPELSGSFNIREITALVAMGDMVQELHRHSFFFLLILEKGSGEHSIDFIPYQVADHTVFFLRPGQVHQLILKKGSTGYLMAFDPGFYNPLGTSSRQVFLKASTKNYCSIDKARADKLLSVLATIFSEYSEKADRYREAIRANLDLFFIELLRQSKNPGSVSEAFSYQQERLEELQDLLEKNIIEHKQVSHYSDLMHLTPFQLNTITKEILGKTCSQLINEQIVLEAKRQLLATTAQVNQIAWGLGYEDPSYFIRFFKKHTGHSPEAFRQSFK